MAEPGKERVLTEEEKAWRALFGEENYKAQGSPMFTKLWTYEELETVERPMGFGRNGVRGVKKNKHADFVRPDTWPADTEPEPGNWVFWLPEGWAQGIRTQVNSGKKLSCYMNPAGKRYWHKKDIEKALGYSLPSVDLRPNKDEGDEPKEEKEKAAPRTRYITDPDAIPNWPEDDEDWLPRDFKLAFRQLPSGLHRIYIPPGKENEGFLYHRSTVVDWLAGKVNTVSPFGSSKPMAEISAAAAEKGPSSTKKRKHFDGPQPAKLEDFEEVNGMSVVRLGGSSPVDALKQAKAQDPEKLASDAKKLQDILSDRRFEDTSLLYVFQRGEQHPISLYVAGFYYKRPSSWNEKEAYQKICLASPASAGVACSALHICWSTTWEGHWKIGRLDDDVLGRGYLGFCGDNSMESGWKLPRAELLKPKSAPPSSSKTE